MTAAMGLDSIADIESKHIFRREKKDIIENLENIYT